MWYHWCNEHAEGIQTQRLDSIRPRPRAAALSWAPVSGRTWLPDKRCRHHPDEPPPFQRACLLTRAGLESPERSSSPNQQQTDLPKGFTGLEGETGGRPQRRSAWFRPPALK